MKNFNLIKRLWTDSHEKQSPQRFARYAAMLIMLLTLGVGQMWAATYILGLDGSWTENTAYQMASSGITNWVYKSMQPTGQWNSFKVKDGSTWYGKDSGSNDVTVGTVYSPTTSGGDIYCNFSQYSSMPYYFFFNTSTHKFMIQPNYYLAGTCGVTDHNWATNKNTNTYDATNGYFKWNTCSLTAGTKYEFKLTNGQGTAWTYTFADWSGVTVTQGTKNSENSGNIEFTPTYGGTAVITFDPTNNNMVIHCPYRIQYNKGANGTGTISNGYKTWNTSFTLSSSTFSRDGYTQDGWSTSDGGAKVYELGGSYTENADVTLYPHWSENMSSVSLVSSPASKGTFSVGGATVTSTTAGATTTRSVTAVPVDGYHFVSWAISGGATISGTTDNPVTVTGDGTGDAATLTATFAADDVYSLTVAAGTGISAVTGSTNDIKAGDDISITATVATGYTWSTWTKTGAGTLSTYTAGTKNQTVTVGTAGDITLTATATETMRTITINGGTAASTTAGVATQGTATAAPPAAGKKFTGWTLGSGVTLSGGALTDRTINFTATANSSVTANYADRASVKLYFPKPSGWTKVYAYAWKESGTANGDWPGVEMTSYETVGCVNYYYYLYYTEADGIGGAATGSSTWDQVIFSNNGATQTNDLAISNGHYYYKADAAASSGRAAALASAWLVEGDFNSWGETDALTPNCGANTATKTISLTTGNKTFKIYNIVNDQWWRIPGNITATKAATTMNNNDGNMTLTPSVAGNYTFTVGSTNSTPTLAVTYPTSYTLTYGIGTVKGNNGSISTSPTTASGSKVLSGNSVELTAPAAKTGYTWSGWFTNAAGTEGQIADDERAITVTMNADKTLYACYTINNHAITHSVSTNGDYTIKVGSAAAVSTNTTSDYGKTITLAATPATGYHLGSWSAYKTETPATTVTVTDNKFTMPDYAVTVGATFSPNTYTVHFHRNGGAGDVVEQNFTYDVAQNLTANTYTRTGYTFAGWAESTSGAVVYADGAEVSNLTSENGATFHLYAKWTANTYTVSFNVNGGTASTPDSKSVTFGAAYGSLPGGMTHASKTFVGWYDDPDDGEGNHITAETIVSTASNHTLYAHYENVYSVNVNFKSGTATIYPATSVNASPTSLAPTITAPEIFGYSFVNWTGSNATFGNASSATTTVNATAATTVTANYNVVPTVYFKNNLGWDSVFVSFNCSFVEGKENVPSNNGKPYYKMTQIGSSDIYYCVIPSTYTASDYAGWAWNIAFDNTNYGKTATTTHTGTWSEFYGGECVGRGDFDPKATLYIPYNGDTETRNTATFYKTGCWMKYNSTESGYQVNMNTIVTGSNADTCTVKLTAASAGGYEFSAKIKLHRANYTYGFKLYKIYQKNTSDLWYTNTGTIYANTETLPWDFHSGTDVTSTSTRCGLHTEALGDYTITVSFATGRPMVNVEYPTQVGDWRLAYNDLVAWSGTTHEASWYLYSRVIKAKANAVDTVSFYVSKATGANAHIELQKCTAINHSTGAETWTKQGSDLDLSSITGTGIYNFKVTQNGSKEASAVSIGGYEGNFYIRTDVSDGGWSNYKTSGANVMTYSEFAENNSGFTHYYMRYVNTGTNIKFCIANDYSECISDTLVSDTYTGEYIAAYGNVRFMWDHRTNRVSRAYISGSTNVGDRFLVLEGSAKMFDENGNALNISGLNANEMKFSDDQNWIYEATIKAKPGAKALLTAKYNNKIQYFGGSGPLVTDSVLLLGGSDANKYKIRVVYDFKTNRLIKAFIPDGAIGTDLAIEADLMIIREHQENAHQVTFSESGKLSKVKTVYGAMKFNKYTVNGKSKEEGHASTGDSRYKRDLFYISFPFDVKLNEAFGFGTYGQHWIIEYYDGKGRAKNGYWAESGPNWKFVTPSERNAGYTMKAFEGYILALELDEMAESASIWDNGVQDVYIYFPSNGNVNDIQATNRLISISQEGYECTIDRSAEIGGSGLPLGPEYNRTIKDSYWHCIGVPSFANYSRDLYETNGGTKIDWQTPSLPYLYEWNWANNTLRVTTSATFNFKATWSYLVQYAGEHIYWSSVNATPAAIVARERTAPKNAEFRIELQKAGEKADQTFVRLTEEENVTTGFDFNYDLIKEFNRNLANIYTLIGTEPAAGNVLPLTDQTTVVPVGVIAKTDGDYTFSIPEGTEGIGVTLIDNETGIRTSLSAVDYTINLSAGTYNDRFLLEISPIKHVATGIETVNEEGGATNGARKIMIDGLLYIVKDGKVFDAQGRQVK